MGTQEFLPYCNRRAESEYGANNQLRAMYDVGNLSLLDLKRIAVTIEGQRKRCGEPVSDHRQFLVRIDALSIARKPGIAGILVVGFCHVTNSKPPCKGTVVHLGALSGACGDGVIAFLAREAWPLQGPPGRSSMEHRIAIE